MATTTDSNKQWVLNIAPRNKKISGTAEGVSLFFWQRSKGEQQ
jgi:hypothetical protein